MEINIKLSVVAAKELEKAIARELEDVEEKSLGEILKNEEDTSSPAER